ncbi:MAG TPA: hypothetical protein PLZ93_10190 [Nocardioides sp.]|uniref:hypothetical protein n=1 Tax=uncultured Nocardioides sp. TaxID=198441 RepID=UPI002609894A|nr:hypothetical protein [uncultured Nocardioides sp.]HRD61905.1 hypothetical protein [Nocardioides sp.]HRI95973.1 hypothetical protein [Nocardioides sp.]HRK46967.1 hypothetical protein [Nocardioides sp.]
MTTRLLAAAAAATLSALLAPSAAHAAYPSTGTTYKDVVDQGDGDRYEAHIKIKIGSDKKKIAKIVVTATCEDKGSARVVWKNVKIYPGGTFSAQKSKKGKMTYSIQGTFTSAQGASGGVNHYTCYPFGFPFYAEK